MNDALVGQQYDRWLRSGSISSRGYAFLASVPGMMLINTPVYRFDRNLGLKPEQRLLDIGCGPGSLLRILSSRVRFQTPPTGIDLSREMLTRALTAERSFTVAQGSAGKLPFVDASFDIAVSGYLLKHLDDSGLTELFREIERVLKPGGIAVLWEFGPTRSSRLNRLNRWVVTRGVTVAKFRSHRILAEAAREAGFDWVENAYLRPFLFPPIPRVSIAVGKAPEGWRESTGPGRARRAALAGANGSSQSK